MILTGKQVKYRGTVTGLRISAVDGTAFIDNALITPELQNAKLLSSGSVTAANLKLSAVDGTAFVDFSTADVLTDNIGKYIVIKDSTGKEIKGWIKAAGSGEGLGDEKIDTWTNYGYDTLTLSGSDILSAVDAGTDNITVIQNIALISGGIYKFVLNSITVASGSSPIFVSGSGNKGLSTSSAYFSKNPASSGTYYYTVTSPNTYHGFRNGGGNANWSASGISLKQVTAPSSTGVTIVSSKGGTTYNWESKDASFAYNSDITYSIYDRDLTAYADGNHQIEIYDASNRMLRGVLKAAGSSETLGDELVTNGDNEAAVMSGENFRQTVTQSSEQAQAGTYSAKAVLSGGTGTHYSRWAIDRLKLYKMSGYFYLPSGQTVNKLDIGEDYKTEASFGISKSTTLKNQWINLSLYTTPYGTLSNHVTAGSLQQYNADEDYYYYDTFTIKQVLAPSASGATIVSAKGGTTYNFAYKDTSFTYNAASYYCIVSKVR